MTKPKDVDAPPPAAKRDGQGRFAPGQTGNRRGRPPGRKAQTWGDAVRRAQDEKVHVSEGGAARAMTKREIAAIQLVNQSAAGDKQAIKLSAQLTREAEAEARDPQAGPQHSEEDIEIVARLVRRIRGEGI